MVSIRKAPPGSGETLRALHSLTLPGDVHEDYTQGTWWLAYDQGEPVAFAGMRQARTWSTAAYLCRAGVLASHRGQGLQRRLIRARVAEARRAGFKQVITTTFENPASANNLIREGFLTYLPQTPWGADGTVYWLKGLT